jgi:ELWxxDGT repeat protein
LALIQAASPWKSDGITVTLVTQIDSYLSGGLTKSGGQMFFSVQRYSDNNYELWKTDGTIAGTLLLKSFPPEGWGPGAFTDVEGTLFFTADDGVSGMELWKSDGTAAGTVLVQDIAPGTASSNPAGMTVAGDQVFFVASNGTTGRELWALGLGVDVALQVPTRIGVMPGDAAAIPIQPANHGLVAASALTLTAVLDPALTYAGDTSGTAPTIEESTLMWPCRRA